MGVLSAQESGAINDASVLEETVVESSAPEVTGPREAAEKEAREQQRITPIVTTRKPEPESTPFRQVSSADSISAAEIRTFQRRGIEDILRQTAGVTLVQTGQGGGQTSLFVRGQESDHTVVLLNGRRLPPGLAGLYQLEFLDVSTLESVQLHRGPISSLYGSDALAGALDLRSTDARYVRNNTVEGFAEAGSFETARSGLRIGLREGPLGIAIDGSTTDTENDRPNSAFHNRLVRGNVAYEISDGVQVDVLGYLQNSTVGVAGSNRSPAFPTNQLNDNASYLFSPRFSIVRDDWDFSLFYSHSGNELIASQTGGFDNTLLQVGEEVESILHLRPSPEIELTIGAGHYHYDFSRNPVVGSPTGFNYGFTGVFGQVDWDLSDSTHLLVSYRHDEQDSFSSKGTYSAQLSQEIEETGTTVFGRFATGYKVPSGQDYAFLDPSIAPGTLLPEESQSFELGFRQALGERSEVSVTHFQTEVDNLVDGRFNLATFTVFPTVIDAEIRGTEVEFRTRTRDGLEIYTNYTWLDTEIKRGLYGFGANRPGDRLPRRPVHSLSGGLVLSGDRWSLGAEVTGAYSRLDAGNVPLEDYTVARLFGNLEINDRVELHGRVENALDEEFETVTGFRAPGTAGYLGFRILLGD